MYNKNGMQSSPIGAPKLIVHQTVPKVRLRGLDTFSTLYTISVSYLEVGTELKLQ